MYLSKIFCALIFIYAFAIGIYAMFEPYMEFFFFFLNFQLDQKELKFI